MNKDKEIADKLYNLASCIAKGSASIAMLKNSISDISYAIARLRTNAENDLDSISDIESAIAKVKSRGKE